MLHVIHNTYWQIIGTDNCPEEERKAENKPLKERTATISTDGGKPTYQPSTANFTCSPRYTSHQISSSYIASHPYLIHYYF